MNKMLKWLMNWFHSNCGDGWESDHGVDIKTLENPGWCVVIDLACTSVSSSNFTEIRIDNGDNDWLFCCKRDDQFYGAGDTSKLEVILVIFKEWVDSQQT